MAKALSLKLKDDIFEEVEEITHKLKVPRNTYINLALASYNKAHRRKLLENQLKAESLLVRTNSLKALSELDEITDDILE